MTTTTTNFQLDLAPTIHPRRYGAPTRRACEAACRLGISLDPPEANEPASPRAVALRTGAASSAPPRSADTDASADHPSIPIAPGALIAIVGPSGAGKSTLLRAAAQQLRRNNWRILNPALIRLRPAPAVDLLGHDADSAMRLLSFAGLADAWSFVRRPGELSDGQRSRLQLAIAVDRAQRSDVPVALLIDEFGSGLDLPAASCAARLLRHITTKRLKHSIPHHHHTDTPRHPSAHPLPAALIATSNPDLLQHLAPNHTIHISPNGAMRIEVPQTAARKHVHYSHPSNRSSPLPPLPGSSAPTPLPGFPGAGRGQGEGLPSSTPSSPPMPSSSSFSSSSSSSSSPPPSRISIIPGSLADYSLLSTHHYCPAPPRAAVRTLLATDTSTGEVVGALVVSMPTLNGAWRNAAWPGRFNTPDQRENAKRINQQLRRIARVVVDPRFRMRGIARMLVRAYLDNPLTHCTETVAAMGRWAPFFTAAGMTPQVIPTPKRDQSLLSLLARANVEPWRLAMPRAAWDRAVQALSSSGSDGRAILSRALRTWADASRATRKLARHDPFLAFQAACATLPRQRLAYTAEQLDSAGTRNSIETHQTPSSPSPRLCGEREG